MSTTKTTIMDTAERLFAEQGLQTVSVRKIMQEAGINLALAHYYFGSKENLIKEVLSRRIVPMNKERLRLLELLNDQPENDPASLEDALAAFFGPVVNLIDDYPAFGRFLGHIHVMSDEMIRKFYSELFDEVLINFRQELRKILPTFLTSSQRLCRGYFMLGSMLLIMTNYLDAKQHAITRGDKLTREIILNELITYTAAGLRANPSGEQALPKA